MILGVDQLAGVIESIIPTSPYNFVFAGFIQPESSTPTVSSNLIVGPIGQLRRNFVQRKGQYS